MKKLFLFLVIGLFMNTLLVFASIDSECQGLEYDFGIEKFEWNEETQIYELETNNPNYNIQVTGTDSLAYWTANPVVDGVIHKEDNLPLFDNDGGSSGTIYQHSQHAISHITFCGNENEIPEFSTITAGLALLGAGAGFVLLRRRK